MLELSMNQQTGSMAHPQVLVETISDSESEEESGSRLNADTYLENL